MQGSLLTKGAAGGFESPILPTNTAQSSAYGAS
jgi:hypothetical protein